jgi:hypothetical protein
VTALEPLLRRACELEPDRFQRRTGKTPHIYAVQYGGESVDVMPSAEDALTRNDRGLQAAVQEAIRARKGSYLLNTRLSWGDYLCTATVNLGVSPRIDTSEDETEALLLAFVAAVEAAKETT